MNMELRHLRYFVAVAAAGSFTRAAQRLHTAQPSLTRQIRELENNVGAKLLVRGRQGVSLTAAGTTMLAEAQLTLAQFERTIALTRDAACGRRRLALGMIPGTEDELITEVHAVLNQHMRDVVVEIRSKHEPELIDALERGSIDAAFVRATNLTKGLDAKFVRAECLMVIFPRNHRLRTMPVIDIADLAGLPLVSAAPHAAPGLRALTDDYLRQHAPSVTFGFEADTMLSLFSMVDALKGFSLVPSHYTRMLPKGIIARCLNGAVPRIDLVLAYPAKGASATLEAFFRFYPPNASA
jgi:LysR family transcriptional regulator, hca operon transcriptional activator